ncbi:MAG: endo-1,4-beta-xylanase, partial [Steroidobacteraceae bacterium]
MRRVVGIGCASAFLSLGACGGGASTSPPPDPGGDEPPPGIDVDNLYVLAPAGMPVGVAVPAGGAANSVLASAERRTIVDAHFSQVTAENIMKPSFLHPERDRYFFDDADALVGYAASQGKTVHGHVLIWHNRLPGWIGDFAPGDTTAWRDMLADHVTTIVSRYAADNVVVSWDVVNEAFADRDDDGDGLYDLRDTVWLDNAGPEYLELAFRSANAVDADADLYYNDYNLAGVPEKLDAVLAMVED